MWLALESLLALTALAIVLALVYILVKLLQVPQENDPDKLYFRTFPKPRWHVKPTRGHDRGRILLMTYGTRGDVQPLVILAKQLSPQYQVAISTCDSFKDFVEREHGCKFISCGVPVVSQPSSLQNSQTFAQVIRVFGDVYYELARGLHKACVEFEPDLIIAPALIRGIASQCAEQAQVPFWSLHFAPSSTPTRAFPPPGFAPQRLGVLNRLLYTVRAVQIAQACVACKLSKTDEDFRVQTLNLPRLPVGDLLRDVEREPALHAYSPALCPKPEDWTKWTLVCGALGEDGEAQVLDERLLGFIQKNSALPLVYVGLGSMENVEELLADIVCALERMGGGLRIIVHSYTIASTPTRLAIGQAPHLALFPHCSLVIHHGGAGTTHAAMQCGAPQIIFPVLKWSDQPFWADRVEEARVGYHCSNYSREEWEAEDGGEFAQRVRACLEPQGEIQTRARALAAQPQPSGKHAIAKLVDEYFN